MRSSPSPGRSTPSCRATPGSVRTATTRSTFVAEEIPKRKEDRKPNTLYTGSQGLVQMCYRVYLPDINRDGSAGVGLPTYEAKLPREHKLSDLLKKHTLNADEVKEHLNRPMSQGIAAGMTVEQWKKLRDAPDNDPALPPESIPARNPPVVERYFNNKYSFIGVFKTPEARAKLPQEVETGFGGDPVTLYLFSWVSRAFGPVLVLRGKMPRFPDTFEGTGGKGLETMTDWQSRYWSLVICEAPPSGLSNDGLTDMQVPLDADGNYTIVISRVEDRPANATDRKRRRLDGVVAPRRGDRRPVEPAGLRDARLPLHVQRPVVGAQPAEDHRTRDRGRCDGTVLPEGRVHGQGDLRGERTEEMNDPENLTDNEKAANGPFPGDMSRIAEEWAACQKLDTPGYFKSLNGAEVADAQRSQCYPAASFLGSMDGPNKVFAWRSRDSYQGVLFMNNRRPGELYLTGGQQPTGEGAGPPRTVCRQGRRHHRQGDLAHLPRERQRVGSVGRGRQPQHPAGRQHPDRIRKPPREARRRHRAACFSTPRCPRDRRRRRAATTSTSRSPPTGP